jgi:hypothetical protein
MMVRPSGGTSRRQPASDWVRVRVRLISGVRKHHGSGDSNGLVLHMNNGYTDLRRATLPIFRQELHPITVHGSVQFVAGEVAAEGVALLDQTNILVERAAMDV